MQVANRKPPAATASMSSPKLALHLTSACCRKHQNTKPTSRSTGWCPVVLWHPSRLLDAFWRCVLHQVQRWFQTWLCCPPGSAGILQAGQAFANIVASEGFTKFRGGRCISQSLLSSCAFANVFRGLEYPMSRTWNCGKRGHQWFFWMYSWRCQIFLYLKLFCDRFHELLQQLGRLRLESPNASQSCLRT